MTTPLFTLTGNLLAETTVQIGEFREGETHRARRETFQVGGKGINVARVALRMGLKARAFYFPGGWTGKRCREWLEGEGVPNTPVWIDGESRAGLVVRADGRETTFLGMDRPVPIGAWQEAAGAISEIPEGSIFCVCGSFPGWSDEHGAEFSRLVERLRGRGCYVAVDTYGPPLADMASCPVDLVKINSGEFRGLFSGEENALLDIPALLEQAGRHFAAASWIVTDGPRPVHAREAGGIAHRQVPEAVREVSATGSGDTFLCAFLFAMSRGDAFSSALAFASRAGARNAASENIGDFSLAEIGELSIRESRQIRCDN